MNEITGRAKGGVARAEKLSPERRSEIARKAALARHGNNPPVAIHKGNFKDDFGFDIDCYVLDNKTKTAVITQGGFALTLGLSDSWGSRLPRFVNNKYMQKYITPELRLSLESPIVFQTNTKGNIGRVSFAKGYDVTILIDLCNAILSAKSSGEKVPEHIVSQAQMIVSASAKSGIQELVYKLSGFDSTKEQFISAFKQFVAEEARKYEKEFPNELYQEWARLYSLTIPKRGRPWQFKGLTNQHIYYPLAKSDGKLLTLLRESKDKDGDRRKKLFQFLNEIGARALRMHLGRVLEMAESSKNSHEYEQKISERFGGQFKLELDE